MAAFFQQCSSCKRKRFIYDRRNNHFSDWSKKIGTDLNLHLESVICANCAFLTQKIEEQGLSLKERPVAR